MVHGYFRHYFFKNIPINAWDSDESYIQAEKIQVVNDSTERSVKLSTDFLSLDRSENKCQNVL